MDHDHDHKPPHHEGIISGLVHVAHEVQEHQERQAIEGAREAEVMAGQTLAVEEAQAAQNTALQAATQNELWAQVHAYDGPGSIELLTELLNARLVVTGGNPIAYVFNSQLVQLKGALQTAKGHIEAVIASGQLTPDLSELLVAMDRML